MWRGYLLNFCKAYRYCFADHIDCTEQKLSQTTLCCFGLIVPREPRCSTQRVLLGVEHWGYFFINTISYPLLPID